MYRVGLESLWVLTFPVLNFPVIFSEFITMDLVPVKELVFRDILINSQPYNTSEILEQFINEA